MREQEGEVESVKPGGRRQTTHPTHNTPQGREAPRPTPTQDRRAYILTSVVDSAPSSSPPRTGPCSCSCSCSVPSSCSMTMSSSRTTLAESCLSTLLLGPPPPPPPPPSTAPAPEPDSVRLLPRRVGPGGWFDADDDDDGRPIVSCSRLLCVTVCACGGRECCVCVEDREGDQYYDTKTKEEQQGQRHAPRVR
jgi:hypothetical protein